MLLNAGVKNPSQNHANLGKIFEKILERTHQVYTLKRLADIDKNPIEWRFTSKSQYDVLRYQRADLVAITNTGRYIKRVKSDIDFSGTAKMSDGRGISIHFDAKEITRKSFPLANVQAHQVERLLSKQQCGAIAGLMIRFSDLERIFFVSATVVDAAMTAMLCQRGSKSIPLIDCEQKGIEIPNTKLTDCDWHSVLIK
jgi:recombination protein U